MNSSCTLLIIFIYSVHLIWKKANIKIDTYPAMICWTCWLAYGLAFKGTGVSIPDVTKLLSGIGLLAITASLYRPGLYDNPTLRVIIVIVYTGLILMLPNEDSIATDCSIIWILFKASIFYAMYIACNSERRIMANRWMHMKRASEQKIDASKIKSFGGEKLFYNSIERTILQSVWILFVKWYFLPLGIAGVAGVSWWLKENTNTYATYKKNDTMSSRGLDKMENGVIRHTTHTDSVTIIEPSTEKRDDNIRDLAMREDVGVEITEYSASTEAHEVEIEDVSEYHDSVDDGIDEVFFEDITGDMV